MKYWIINHKFSSYQEHNNLIGLPAKLFPDGKGNRIPKYKATNEIRIGDKIVYYCPSPKRAVIGLFEIISAPGIYAEDWYKSIHFKIRQIYPIKEENQISYYKLVDVLQFFKDENGNTLPKRSAATKLMGTIKLLDEEDFNLIEKMLLKEEEEEAPIEPPPEEIPSKISLHIKMIKGTHLLSDEFNCDSYIGSQEQKRVEESLSDEEAEIAPTMDTFPSWIADIATQLGTIKRIAQIDNIWFVDESKGFLVPFAAFEHEKDGNLRTVMDHFYALDNTLNSNNRFRSVNPLYFIIGKDEKQTKSYERIIESHGEWNKFSQSHDFQIYHLKQFSSRAFKKHLNAHLREIFQESTE